VDSVPAWSSYFSPEKQETRRWERGRHFKTLFGKICLGSEKSISQCHRKPGIFCSDGVGYRKWNGVGPLLYPSSTAGIKSWSRHLTLLGLSMSNCKFQNDNAPIGLWWGPNGCGSTIVWLLNVPPKALVLKPGATGRW
jgi:hypothetical protein